jgi:hypothetical protein
MANNRVFWAIVGAGLAGDGEETFTEVHGLQSVGVTTSFNLEQVFELGQIAIYENVEDLPEIEVTLEKVLDGYPLIYHLASPNATTGTLTGRSADKCIFSMSIFGDTQDSASGTPVSQVVCSGMYVSSLSYTLPVDGNCTEAVTLVGNNKVWKTSDYTFSGTIFDNTDSPASGVQRRQDVVFGSGAAGSVSLVPWGAGGIPGVSDGGFNEESNGVYNASVQTVTISTDLGREALNELGRRNPYFRYVTFPTEVTTDIEITTKQGDLVEATESGVAGNGNNLFDQRIFMVLGDGTSIDTGSKNKLSSVSQTGGDAGGGNMTTTYSYTTFNELTVLNAGTDPAGLSS